MIVKLQKPIPPAAEVSPPTLINIAGLPETVVAELARRWVTTPEQLLGLAATPEGRSGLRDLSGLDEAGLTKLLQQVSSAARIPPGQFGQLPPKAHPFGLALKGQCQDASSPTEATGADHLSIPNTP